jgi:glycosyltransferase involved in cell wall biosynthesis
MNRYSALIPVYKNDSLLYLSIAVESMLNQTRPFDEILLVVEGKVNNEIEKYLTSLNNPVQVLRIENQKGPLNFGLPATLNFGIKNATGDYIVRLDSDDYSVPERLEKVDAFLNKHASVNLLSSWVDEYDEDLDVLISTRRVPLLDREIRKKGKWKNPFNGPAAVFKRETALGLGGYPIVASNEDFCFWAEFIINGNTVGNIAEPLVKMRTGRSMIPRRKSKRYRMGTIQSNAYLYSIGYFGLQHLVWHSVINSILRRLPTRVFYLFQYKVFRYVKG